MSEIAKHWIDGEREGDLPAVPRGQLRHRSQLPQGRLVDRPDGGRRRAVPGRTL